jgi:CBS domain-containing protein
VLVTRNGNLLGILTDRDIAVRLAADDVDFNEVKVSDVMSENLLTLKSNLSITGAIEALSAKGVRRAPIKVNVGVNCILASYSFKYFGKGKRVTVYTYVDERQLLFHFTLMTLSEREAAYVIDGLLQNEVVKSDIHSTDTHGFTETVFAATHFINTAFAVPPYITITNNVPAI